MIASFNVHNPSSPVAVIKGLCRFLNGLSGKGLDLLSLPAGRSNAGECQHSEKVTMLAFTGVFARFEVCSCSTWEDFLSLQGVSFVCTL